MSLRYKQVEAALALAFEVAPKDMGAFRARIRNLRKLGVPNLPTPGSGQPIEYSDSQALEMLIALELERLRIAPSIVSSIAPSIRRQLPPPREMVSNKDWRYAYAAVSPKYGNGWTGLFTREAFREFLTMTPITFSLINLSACARKLVDAIKRSGLAG